jgi:HEAT repeats
VIPQDTTEIIWAFSGTVVGLILCVAIASIIRQVRHNSTGSSQADRWEEATSAVMGFVTGDAARSDKFSKLLKREDTRTIVIEAFSNVARANPDSAQALRHRKEDVALLRQWVADSLENKESGIRAHACEVVGTLRVRACHGMILAATGDEDANVRVAATRALCVIDAETAVGVLLGLIEKDGSWAADLLADLLQRIPERATTAVMLRAREWGATPALVRLLAGCPSDVANTVLLGALETENPELRARVAEAIQASSPEAIAALATLLTDPHEGTRLSAVRSLGRVRNPKALITLSSALSDGSRLVRFAAAEGIAGTAGGAELLHRIVAGSDRNAAEAAELALWRIKAEGARGAVTAQDLVVPADTSLGQAPLRLSDRLDRLADQLEHASDLTFEMALATLLDEARDPVTLRSDSIDRFSEKVQTNLASVEACHVVPIPVETNLVVSIPTVSEGQPLTEGLEIEGGWAPGGWGPESHFSQGWGSQNHPSAGWGSENDSSQGWDQVPAWQ